jgi:hypothetical protein
VKELARAGLRNPLFIAVRVENRSTAAPTAPTDSAAAGGGGNKTNKTARQQRVPASLQHYHMVSER